jgi:hypothetical protein
MVSDTWSELGLHWLVCMVEIELRILKCGSCEPLKLGVHASAFGLAVVMGLYNAAAWLSRREPHLAVNAVLYAALTAWETEHIRHHLDEIRKLQVDAVIVGADAAEDRLAA